MALPPQDDAHTAGSPGHPEPMPAPDPDPPQPIPPPEPVPTPHPPQVGDTATSGTVGPVPVEQPTDQPSWQAMPVTIARERRTTLWVSLTLVITLLLCGGGGVSAYLLLRNAEKGDGAPDPATAVNRFMAAVYQDQDATAANGLICSEARDQKKISAKVDEVKGYGVQYDAPTFAWPDPSVASESTERALVSVALTMTTEDERTSRQQLTFTVVKRTGWWVCEVAG